jgi:hypothetical protein
MKADNWVQATPGCASLLFLSQRPPRLTQIVKRAEAKLGVGARGIPAWPTGRGRGEGGEADMLTS